jgi:U3 small nucleolar RNA-associated protein 11
MNSAKVDGMSGNNSGKHLKTEERRRKDLEEKGLGDEAVRIMKDQDLSYVRMQRMMDDRKIAKLQSSLHYLTDGNDTALSFGKKRKHTVFIEGDVQDFDPVKHFDTVPELLGRAFNRPRMEDLEKEARKKLTANTVGKKMTLSDLQDDYYNDSDGEEVATTRQLSEKQLKKQKKAQRKLEKHVAKSRSAAYTEMEMRSERMQKLKAAEDALVVEKQCQMKGRRRKIAGGQDGKPALYKWRRKRAK